MVIAEISALLSAVKSAYDLAKGIGTVYVDSKSKEASEILQEKLFSIK